MKKGKGILVIFILLLIVILAGGAYAYIKTDLLKTPEQLFKKYLINNMAQIANVNIAPFNEVSERMENELTETNLNIILNGEAIGEEETYKLKEYAGNAKSKDMRNHDFPHFAVGSERLRSVCVFFFVVGIIVSHMFLLFCFVGIYASTLTNGNHMHHITPKKHFFCF